MTSLYSYQRYEGLSTPAVDDRMSEYSARSVRSLLTTEPEWNEKARNIHDHVTSDARVARRIYGQTDGVRHRHGETPAHLAGYKSYLTSDLLMSQNDPIIVEALDPFGDRLSVYSRDRDHDDGLLVLKSEMEDRLTQVREERMRLEALRAERLQLERALELPDLPPYEDMHLKPAISRAVLPAHIMAGSTITPFISYYRWGLSDTIRFDYRWVVCDSMQNEISLGNSAWQYVDHSCVGKTIKLYITSSCGDNILAISQHPVVGEAPSVHHLMILGEPREGESLTLSYDYSGGLNVRPRIAWFRGAEEVVEARECLSYTTTKRDCYKQILVEVTPLRDDGSPGVTVSASTRMIEPAMPYITELEIEGRMEVGSTIRAVVPPGSYRGGSAGRPLVRWYRQGLLGEDAVQVYGDLDGSYQLAPADAGHLMKAVYTPVRVDGELGKPMTALSATAVAGDAPQPALPYAVMRWQHASAYTDPRVGDTLAFEVESEDPQVVNDPPSIQWFRDLSRIGHGNSSSYVVQREDVGHRIHVCYAVQGTWGTWQEMLESGVVRSDRPEVRGARIAGEFKVGKRLHLEREVDGLEARRTIKWYRMAPEGGEHDKMSVASDTSHLQLEADDCGCLIAADYTPIGETGVPSDTFRVTTSDRIQPGEPTAAAHGILGELVVGNEIIADVEVNHHNMKGDDIVTWYRAGHEVGQAHNKYLLTPADVGSHISYEYTPVNSHGVKGNMVSYESPGVVQKPDPVPLQNVFVGRKMAAPFRPPESHHRSVTWYKSRNGTEFSKMYEVSEDNDRDDPFTCVATADLLNHFVKCELTRMGSDGTPISKMETPVEVVDLWPDFKQKLAALLSAGSQTIAIMCDGQATNLMLDHKKIRLMQGGRQLDSAKWNTNAAFALHGDKQDRFKLRLSKDKEYDCSLSEEKQRAMTALTFRCFMGMGIKEIAERVVGKEAAKDWGKGRFEKGGQRLEWNPDYNPTQSRLVQSNTADQLNRKLIHSKDRPLNRLEKTELEIFICRYGLSYWQARVALEYALHP